MNGLTAKRGLAAIIDVRKFLVRLDALEFSPERKSDAQDGPCGLALLEKRGITKVKRNELRAAIQTAQSFKVTLAKDERTAETLEAAKKETSI